MILFLILVVCMIASCALLKRRHPFERVSRLRLFFENVAGLIVLGAFIAAFVQFLRLLWVHVPLVGGIYIAATVLLLSYGLLHDVKRFIEERRKQ